MKLIFRTENRERRINSWAPTICATLDPAAFAWSKVRKARGHLAVHPFDVSATTPA